MRGISSLLLILSVAGCAPAGSNNPHASTQATGVQEQTAERKWVASWATAIGMPLREAQPTPGFTPAARAVMALFHPSEFNHALPDGKAADQTFRMIVKPDLWSDTIRVRFSNVFGDRPLSLSAAAVALQENGGHVLPGTSVALTFDGRTGLSIPAGEQAMSDPVRLSFVTPASKLWLRGRHLAVSFFIRGQSGLLSVHSASTVSFVSRPYSGDHTLDEADSVFPYVTQSFVIVNEVDVLADPGTAVVCALGESITDKLQSCIVQIHRRLINAGVTTELRVWDVMWHSFYQDVDIVESKDSTAAFPL